MEFRPRSYFCSLGAILFLLLALASSASGSQVSGISRSLRIFTVERRRLVAAPPSEDSVIAGPTPTPRGAPPFSAPPPSNTRPALITPSSNAPGPDLPPKRLHAPPPSLEPISSPGTVSSTTTRSNTGVIVGVTLGVVVVLLVAVSAAVFFKPEWLPCCKGRSSRLSHYERHVPT